jgi:hypothetical protein
VYLLCVMVFAVSVRVCVRAKSIHMQIHTLAMKYEEEEKGLTAGELGIFDRSMRHSSAVCMCMCVYVYVCVWL